MIISLVVGLVIVAIAIEAYRKSGTHRPLSASKPRVADVNRHQHHNFIGKTPTAGVTTLLDDLQEIEAEEERLRTQSIDAATKARRVQHKLQHTQLDNDRRAAKDEKPS